MQLRLFMFILLSFAVASCSTTKRLPKGETLFAGSKVIIDDDEASKKERKLLISDLKSLVRPRPNSNFLGLRIKLYLYTSAGDVNKKKGLRKWLREKAGEPPVLTSSLNLNTNRSIFVNHLQNKGFFFSKCTAELKTDSSRRKATAVFHVTTRSQYTIKKTFLIKDASEIGKNIDSTFSETLLIEGAPYNLDLIKAERIRIDKVLKEKGYYFFKPDYLQIVVDSTIGGKKVNMYIAVKTAEVPADAYTQYKINEIYINANYHLTGKNADTAKAAAVVYDGLNIVDPEKKYRPFIFSDALLFEKGELYNRTDQNATLSRLINLGTFKFVKNRFDAVNDSLLDVYFYLTPYPKKSIRAQIGALTQNDNKAGSQASVSWKNRNAFKGAEEFLVKVHGTFEFQYGAVSNNSNIYNVGAETNISVPRFLVPFIDINTTNKNLPHTLFKLKYDYESQSNLLRINSYTASYGFNWKQGAQTGHQLYPFNFTYVKTDTLGDLSKLNAYYSSLVFNGIIIGPTYEITISPSSGLTRKHTIYFDGLVDLSGNILGLLQKADHDKNLQTILGSPYAQYIKLQPDLRYYYKLAAFSNIATRLVLGFGLPYGNSRQLPNIKQFWAGGNSDLRGFQSRLLGPGTFSAYNDARSTTYLQTLGDLKLEFNTELRQHIYSFLNGAFFFDAGNIWLYNDNPVFKGGTFSPHFYKELAADMGVGLRFDFKILILRFDLGIPIRKPWLDEGKRWTLNTIDFGDTNWRRNNMVLNIGIGYPF